MITTNLNLTASTKVAFAVFAGASLTQVIAGQRLLKYIEEIERKNAALRQAGLYLISILERENVQLEEFDHLALEALRPNPTTDDTGGES